MEVDSVEQPLGWLLLPVGGVGMGGGRVGGWVARVGWVGEWVGG